MLKHFLKSVKMHFSGNTKFWGFKKSTNLFIGFRIHFFLKIGTLDIVKNRFRIKKMKFIFLKKKMGFLTKNCNFRDVLEIFSQRLETHLSYNYNIKMGCFGTKNFCQMSYC